MTANTNVIHKNDPIPNKQRAIVMQGGSSLGAYEAGVFKALYEELPKQDKKIGESNRLLFDIFAGTSIGAINAAILVNNFVNNGNWKDSVKVLFDFWQDISTISAVEMDPTFDLRWADYNYLNSGVVATPEAARRYYSVKEFFSSGARNVFTPPNTIPDKKFIDPLNTWYLYDNEPLKKLLEEKYLKDFPLITTKKQPRLLLVSVDVQEATTATFDSYSLKSEYGEYDKQSKTYEYTIEYPEGITIDHVLASASVPISYDYTTISDTKNSKRKFWDGIILSNTPLRELLGAHKTFWETEIPEQDLDNGIWDSQNGKKVPSLDVYIINLWPSKEKNVPYDYDGQIDRKNDILYHDKTKYDQKVAVLVSDYIDLAKRIREIAIKHMKGEKVAFQKELDDFLKINKAKSEFRTGEQRKYIDLLKGRFDVNKVIRIERKDDIHTIANKWADFSSGTIANMINNGYQESLVELGIEFLIDKVIELENGGILDQGKGDSFKEQLLRIKRDYLKPHGEENTKNQLQKVSNELTLIEEKK